MLPCSILITRASIFKVNMIFLIRAHSFVNVLNIFWSLASLNFLLHLPSGRFRKDVRHIRCRTSFKCRTSSCRSDPCAHNDSGRTNRGHFRNQAYACCPDASVPQ